MSLKGFDLLKESAAKRMEYLRDYMNTAKKAKEIIQGKYKGCSF
jgi:hypothetical protein